MESQSVETKDRVRKPSEIGEEIRKELERRGFRAPKQKPEEDRGASQTEPLQPKVAEETKADPSSPPDRSSPVARTVAKDSDEVGERIQDASFDLPDTAELQLMSGSIQHVDVAQEMASAGGEEQPASQFEDPVQVVVDEPRSSSEEQNDLPVTAELDQEVLRVLDAIQNVSEETTGEWVGTNGDEIAQTFLSRASHELRTPLQTINGFLELLHSGKISDRQQVEQFVKLSYREGSYLADRITDIEIASQIDAGPLRISPVLLSMARMIEESVQAFEPFTWDHRLIFERTGDSELPGLYGDQALLMHALRNLIGIALKSSPEGTDVYIRAHHDQETLSIQISNESSDSSIPDEAGTEPETKDMAGESIGIYIAREIIHAHGGWCNAQRSDDLFAFHLDLPLEAPRKRGGTILITEDNAQVAALLEIALEKEGYTPIRATNGLEALEIVANDSVDLVLLDVVLPGMDGFEVCYRMRSSPDSASIPVMIVSAKVGDEHEARALRVGADAYIRKPIQLAQLLVAIDELLDDGSEGSVESTDSALSDTQPLN